MKRVLSFSFMQMNMLHVMKGEGFAKVELENLKVVQNYLKPKDLKTALEIIEENRENFIRVWNEWFS